VEEFHGQLKIGGEKKMSAPRLEGKRKKKKKKLEYLTYCEKLRHFPVVTPLFFL
jgi:hypothetical protein